MGFGSFNTGGSGGIVYSDVESTSPTKTRSANFLTTRFDGEGSFKGEGGGGIFLDVTGDGEAASGALVSGTLMTAPGSLVSGTLMTVSGTLAGLSGTRRSWRIFTGALAGAGRRLAVRISPNCEK